MKSGLFNAKKIDHFFDYGIYGSPDSKHEIINYHQTTNDDLCQRFFLVILNMI